MLSDAKGTIAALEQRLATYEDQGDSLADRLQCIAPSVLTAMEGAGAHHDDSMIRRNVAADAKRQDGLISSMSKRQLSRAQRGDSAGSSDGSKLAALEARIGILERDSAEHALMQASFKGRLELLEAPN